MTDRELMQQALDALDEAAFYIGCPNDDDAIGVARKALRARLAQPELEELGEIIPADEEQLKRIAKLVGQHPLWIRNEEGKLQLHAPPQREWQGLTDEERNFLAWESNNGSECVAMTEAKLKEKNETL